MIPPFGSRSTVYNPCISKVFFFSLKRNDFLSHQLKLVFWVFRKSSQRDDSFENQQHVLVDPLYTGSPKTSTLANSEDPDEM